MPSKVSHVSWLVALLLPAVPIGNAAESDFVGTRADEVRRLTGAETRIVWMRHKQWETYKGGLDGGPGYSIVAFDTGGKGERELVPEGEIFNPLISPSGRRVVYSAKTDGKLQMHCVDWNGANRRILGEGFAQWTWRDPATSIEWVYASNAGGTDAAFVDRFQLDQPETRESIYTGRLANRFSLSADGTRAVGEFPHPATGMFYPRTGQLDRKDYRDGCNTYMSPDNSYFVTIMDSGHGLVTLYKPDGSSRDVSVIPPGLKPLKNGGNGCVWNPKWASDARHLVVAGPFKNLGSDRADIWLGQFADDFNSIAKWVQVTDNDDMDVYAYVWVDPGLGQYAGEAPYTLAVRSDVTGLGNWKWTFGDGTTGTEGKHTYGKAGTYAITARQGDRVLEGTVRVTERVAPKLRNALVLDDRRVLLTCSEPIQVAAAKVTLASGTAATKLSLDSEGSGIIAEFAAPLAAKETLTVTGVTDGAQAPNEMAAVQAQVVRPDWPSNRAGLRYLWQKARTRNVIFDERLGLPVATAITGFSNHQLSVPARFNRFGAAVAAGGGFVLNPGAPEHIFEGIKQTHQFSFEIVVASADLAQTKGDDDKPIAIVDWGFGWRNGIFWLFQEKDKLLVGLSKSWGDNKPEVFEMATLPDAKPHHVIVSLASKRLAFYLDGKKVKEIDPSPASFIEVGAPAIALAAHHADPHKNIWRGTFEYLAMYNRFIEEPEAAKNAAAVAADLAKRKALPRIELQAKLVATSTLPQPAAIAPYRNVLVVNEYSVEKVLKGTYAPKTIRVTQWGMIDLKPTPLAAQALGTSVKLVLEKFVDHDELVPELISDTLKEDFDLDLYTDVNVE
ncbi:MAG: PKD domain-containing protein [Planctomycetota bacterium]